MIPIALKRGYHTLHFPEFPNHPLNGASYEGNGAWTGEEDGLKKHRRLTVFEENENNLRKPAGYWSGTFNITPDMFGVEKLKVQLWALDDVQETFILEK